MQSKSIVLLGLSHSGKSYTVKRVLEAFPNVKSLRPIDWHRKFWSKVFGKSEDVWGHQELRRSIMIYPSKFSRPVIREIWERVTKTQVHEDYLNKMVYDFEPMNALDYQVFCYHVTQEYYPDITAEIISRNELDGIYIWDSVRTISELIAIPNKILTVHTYRSDQEARSSDVFYRKIYGKAIKSKLPVVHLCNNSDSDLEKFLLNLPAIIS